MASEYLLGFTLDGPCLNGTDCLPTHFLGYIPEGLLEFLFPVLYQFLCRCLDYLSVLDLQWEKPEEYLYREGEGLRG